MQELLQASNLVQLKIRALGTVLEVEPPIKMVGSEIRQPLQKILPAMPRKLKFSLSMHEIKTCIFCAAVGVFFHA